MKSEWSKRIRLWMLLVAALLASLSTAHASIKVVATTSDLADLVQHVGGDKVSVSSIVRGDQNPHFVEVKPSYMMKLKSADLLFMVGMELEMWAPQIIDGSRNSNLKVVDLSKEIDKLEVPTRLDASQGDVHRYGNPHYWLDPRNVRRIVEEIVAALTEASPGDEAVFMKQAAEYLTTLDAATKRWEKTMAPFAGTKIVTFHKSWSYFANWLKLQIADQVEPKPGIPPSPGHTAELMALVRSAGIKVIVVEPFYDASAAEQIARSTGAKVLRLATSIGGVDEAKDYISLMEYNVKTLAEALR
jgi:zinc/manganese transport system substrate-binding protein